MKYALIISMSRCFLLCKRIKKIKKLDDKEKTTLNYINIPLILSTKTPRVVHLGVQSDYKHGHLSFVFKKHFEIYFLKIVI